MWGGGGKGKGKGKGEGKPAPAPATTTPQENYGDIYDWRLLVEKFMEENGLTVGDEKHDNKVVRVFSHAD
eukprot:COSAG02_NODE_61400_length_268_cov_1.461538_1_plen_69_part_10